MTKSYVSGHTLKTAFGTLRVAANFDDAERDWRHLETTSVPAPFQTFDWCKHWWTNVGAKNSADLAIVIGHDENARPIFIVPLMITAAGGLRIAALLGDRHSACLGGLFDREALAKLSQLPAGAIATAIGTVAGAGVLQMTCLPVTLNGLAHPLLGREAPVRRGESLSIARLIPDWDAFDAAHRSGETRRKERRNETQLAKLGPVEFIVASTPKSRDRLFNAMAAQKSAWLNQRGLPNFFKDPGVPGFLRAAAHTQSEAAGLKGEITGLMVGDKIVAVSLGVIHGDAFSGLIMSSAEGPEHRFAPGALLLTKSMRHYAQSGIETFCFGAVAEGEGTNDWKARWCDAPVDLVDDTIALTPLGRAYQLAATAKATAAAHVRSKPALLNLARQTRSALLHMRSKHSASHGHSAAR